MMKQAFTKLGVLHSAISLMSGISLCASRDGRADVLF